MARKPKGWTAIAAKEVEPHAVNGNGHAAVAEPPTRKLVLPKTHEEDPYLTYSEVAVRLGVSITTVSRWVGLGVRGGGLAAEWRGPRLCVRESALAEFQGKNYVPTKEK